MRPDPSLPGLHCPSQVHDAPPPLLAPLLLPLELPLLLPLLLPLELPLLEPLLLPLLEPLLDPPHGSSMMWSYRIAVKLAPSYAMSTTVPLHVTLLVNSCAYGMDELQPGSSMKTASCPGVIHSLKIT